MLQFTIWTALREEGIGASIQHYSPVIDDAVKALFDVPASYKLVAQMPFGGIVAEPEPKDKEDIAKRVSVKREERAVASKEMTSVQYRGHSIRAA